MIRVKVFSPKVKKLSTLQKTVREENVFNLFYKISSENFQVKKFIFNCFLLCKFLIKF